MFYLEFFVSLITICTHCLGIYLLVKCKHSFPNSSQLIFLINLSLSEMSIVIMRTLSIITSLIVNDEAVKIEMSFWFHTIIALSLSLPYYFIMIFMALDRFFEVFLNIRYPLYWSPRSTKWLLGMLWILTLLLVFVVGFQPTLDEPTLAIFCFMYFYPVMDTIVILVSLFVYTYIFIKIRKKRVGLTEPSTKNTTKVAQFSNDGNIRVTLSRKKSSTFFVPFMIILTFFLLVAVPDLVGLLKYLIDSSIYQDSQATYLFIFYFLGLTSDAIIYILLYKKLRKRLLKILCCR